MSKNVVITLIKPELAFIINKLELVQLPTIVEFDALPSILNPILKKAYSNDGLHNPLNNILEHIS